MGKHRRPGRGTPRREPVAYAAIVPVVITLAAWLGFENITSEVAVGLIAAIVATAGYVRSLVTPTAAPCLRDDGCGP